MPASKIWSNYNEHLVKLDEFYLALDFIDSWSNKLIEINHNKRSHVYQYPEFLIMFLAVIYHVTRIPYRAPEGLPRGLHKYVPNLRVADYITIAKRIVRMKLPTGLFKDDSEENIEIAVDSTGMKIKTAAIGFTGSGGLQRDDNTHSGGCEQEEGRKGKSSGN